MTAAISNYMFRLGLDPKYTLPMKIQKPHLTQCIVGSQKRTCQMSSKFVKRLKQSARMWQTTDRQTNHAIKKCVAIARIACTAGAIPTGKLRTNFGKTFRWEESGPKTKRLDFVGDLNRIVNWSQAFQQGTYDSCILSPLCWLGDRTISSSAEVLLLFILVIFIHNDVCVSNPQWSDGVFSECWDVDDQLPQQTGHHWRPQLTVYTRCTQHMKISKNSILSIN